ncbi:MAG: hypothetical protein CM1200mP24_06840 [Gammaproteobacteria bacterium]|nr:MAG: hypothetical protein CM1200mP24_06840 [Gammaproteobacteria bacterium]
MSIETVINEAFDNRDQVGPDTDGSIRDAVQSALDGLDAGTFRVAEKGPDDWIVHEWLKKAVLLSFLLNPMKRISNAPGGTVGGTRCLQNSTAGMTRIFRKPVFDQSQLPLSGTQLILHRA